MGKRITITESVPEQEDRTGVKLKLRRGTTTLHSKVTQFYKKIQLITAARRHNIDI